MRAFVWVRSVCGRGLARVWLLCATRCASALNAVGFALFMRSAIDAAVAGDAASFWPALTLFALAILAQICLTTLSKWLSASAQAHVENSLREYAVKGIATAGRLPEGRLTGEVMGVLTSDVSVVTGSVATVAPEVASMTVRAVAAFALMFDVAPALATFFLAAGTACVLLSISMRRWLKRLHVQAQAADAKLRGRLQEVLESLVVVRCFGAADGVLGELRELMGGYLRACESRAGGSAASGAVFGLAMQLSYLVGFGYGCWGILEGRMTYGTLMALVQLVGQVRAPFSSLSGVFPQLAAMSASCERLRDVVPERPRLASPPEGATFSALRFEDVGFAYGDRDADTRRVLSDFDAKIRAGEFVAVTGPSGIGKSTLLMLALGMARPQVGRVVVTFGSDCELDAACLAPGTFAYVPQGNMLMSGSVREAVAFAEPAPVDERVRQACLAACAEFVFELPEGLDTRLGEGGSGLSEGQMQRLAVARAVYSQAPVLLLDECTSALDEPTEREMLRRLRGLGRTVVIVTHRPAALEVCDRVLRMEQASKP